MSAPDINGLLMAHPYGAVILIVLFLVVMAFLNLRRLEKASTRRHRRYRATAGRVLNKLILLPGDGQRLTYLRKISPYVFEELLLSAFERQGLTVVRNASTAVTAALMARSSSTASTGLSRPNGTVVLFPPHMLRTSTDFSCTPAAGGSLSTRAVPEK